ncbi:tRNA-5-carboxymethylaminomethyl-2-thiouridine(34)synthesis protein MnmG, partial [hydrothermal vent metagenome]
ESRATQNRAAVRATIALITLDPATIGVMSCNPAIGGLAKGQLVREIDALGGLMGLAADATGIQFKVLNASKGAAVRGPRCQSDKHAYAEKVQAFIASRPEIEVIAGSVEEVLVEHGCVRGVRVRAHESHSFSTPPPSPGLQSGVSSIKGEMLARKDHPPGLKSGARKGELIELASRAVILTTGTFMRGLMHTGQVRTPGGRAGEGAAEGISASLVRMGFALGRLKTGTPPRLARRSIDWENLPSDLGDDEPTPFSEMVPDRFPELPQVECRQTHTTPEMHDLIRANLDRAPIYSGAIDSTGPRYCPSIEDKVVRFAGRDAHGVFLEPESLRDDQIYCNGISTSLPAEVQDKLICAMPGCAHAVITRYGYAVEYDIVRPHQIHATGMTKLVEGLFLAGQINGTSGYEEAAAQGLVAGVNAVRYALGQPAWTLGRDEAYIGVLMDDLVTKTPVEPYRMFTSRAEHRLLLRADNAPDRLTPIAQELGLLASTDLGRARAAGFVRRQRLLNAGRCAMRVCMPDGVSFEQLVRQDRLAPDELATRLVEAVGGFWPRGVVATLHAELRYEGYIRRQQVEIKRHADMERRELPGWLDYASLPTLRNEAREALARFRPETFGQASRLEGMTPADLTLLAVLVERARRARAESSA